MVLPLIVAAGAGIGGSVLGGLLTGKKEEVVKHAPYEYYAPTTSEVYSPTYSPQIQMSPQYTYAYQGGTYIISSPSATSKKEQEVRSELIPKQEGTWKLPISVSQEPTHSPVQGGVGTDMTKIAIIGAVGLIAYGLISSKRRK